MLSKKISSAIAAIKNVKFLPQETLVTLYYSLVESRLRYCNTVWGNCGNLLKRKLQTLQNRAMRVHKSINKCTSVPLGPICQVQYNTQPLY